MPFMDWSESLSVFVPEMDNQHKQLIALINNFHAASEKLINKDKNKKLFEDLVKYTILHFSNEEKFLISIKFPGIEGHKAIHSSLCKQVETFLKNFENGDGKITKDLLEFLKKWLVNHIQGTDMSYGNFVQEHKL